MQLRTLPSYFKSDQSPMTSTDSPFPPLKVEHRYKSVYERAGFDVNFGGSNQHSSSRSLHLKKSMSSSCIKGSDAIGMPLHAPSRPFHHTNGLTQLFPHSSHRIQQSTAESPLANSHFISSGSHSAPTSAVLESTPVPLPDAYQQNSQGRYDMEKHEQERNMSVEKYSPTKEKYAQEKNTSVVETKEKYSPTKEKFSPTEEKSTAYPETIPSLGEYTRTQNSNDHTVDKYNPYSQRHQPNHAHDKAAPFRAFQPKNPVHGMRPDERNVKNLSIDLPSGNLMSSTSTEASTDSLSMTGSPTFDDTSIFKLQTPQTSASSSGDYGRTVFGRNSTMSEISVKTSELMSERTRLPYPVRDLAEGLDGLRRDVEQQKKYDPRARRANTADEHAQSTEDVNESSQEDLSLQLNSAHRSNETEDSSNEDFENYLKASHKPDVRRLHLSTISSIISKPDRSDDDDDEVERELVRQLEMLKNGSTTNIASDNANSLVMNYDSLAMPSFKIDAVSQNIQSDNESSDANADHNGSFVFCEPSAEQPQAQVVQNMDFNEQIDASETILPLCPKTHRVEEELKDINFRDVNQDNAINTDKSHIEDPEKSIMNTMKTMVHQTDIPEPEKNTMDTAQSDTITSQREEEEILQHCSTPNDELDVKSVVDANTLESHNSSSSKFPPGEGPCRECHQAVDAHGHGGMKAIYSKNGDLSGQWHRQCFTCAYDGCDIKFNKHVACYVLDDNAFCHDHYHTLNGSRCQSCDQGIEGECIENELKQKWHMACFKCSKCQRNIERDYFLVNNNIMCDDDAARHIEHLQRRGLSTNDKIEKRRTRVLYLEQRGL